MNQWYHDTVKPRYRGKVKAEYVKAYGNIYLKEIRLGKFTHIDQAISLLSDESEEIQAAVMRSLKWALAIALKDENQQIIDKIMPLVVLESL